MDSILAALEVNVEKLYKEKKFHEVEEMFSTFLKESQNEPAPIKARALNNRGHAKYMQVEFDAALQDYNEGTPIPVNNLLALHKQYTNCPTLASGYEVGNLYKNLLFIRNIL